VASGLAKIIGLDSVPEPSSFMLLGIGVVSLFACPCAPTEPTHATSNHLVKELLLASVGSSTKSSHDRFFLDLVITIVRDSSLLHIGCKNSLDKDSVLDLHPLRMDTRSTCDVLSLGCEFSAFADISCHFAPALISRSCSSTIFRRFWPSMVSSSLRGCVPKLPAVPYVGGIWRR